MPQVTTDDTAFDLDTPATSDLDAYRCTNIGEGMDAPRNSPLGEAFAALRELGFATDEGDSCCHGCMGGNVENTAYSLLEAGKPVNGYVGYFLQEPGDNLDYELGRPVLSGHYSDDPTRTFTRNVQLHLYYGTPDFPSHDFDLSVREVGELVCGVFDENRVWYNWDGSAKDRITLD